MIKRLALLSMTVLVVARAHAQEPPRCAGELTIGQCLDLYRRSFRVPKPNPNASIELELERKPTGVDVPGSNDVSISDFLSRLSTALIAPGIGSIDKLGTSFNIPLAGTVPAALQIGITLQKPIVFEPLLDALPAHKREPVKERLEAEFGELDQPQLTMALNLETKRFGRRFDVHADELSALLLRLDRLVADSLRKLNFKPPEDFVFGLANLGAHMPADAAPNCRTAARLEVPLHCLTTTYRDTLQDQLRLVGGWFELMPALTQELMRTIGFHHVADLINNQPQINLTGQHDAFSRAVGPTRFALQFRLEMGFANLNSARSHCGGTLQMDCFRAYIEQENVATKLRRGTRLWAAFDASHQPDYSAPFFASDSARLVIRSSWQWQGELGYGTYLDPGEGGVQQSRIDFVAAGLGRQEDGVHEPTRLIASLNLAHRLTDSFAGSIGISWANKPELITDQDLRKLGANVGVRYKLARSKER